MDEDKIKYVCIEEGNYMNNPNIIYRTDDYKLVIFNESHLFTQFTEKIEW